MLNRLISCGVALLLLAVAAPSAAQQTLSDRDLRNLPHSGGLSTEDRKRLDDLNEEDAQYVTAAVAEGKRRQQLLRLPPVPIERNVLLGSWRQEDGGQGLGVLGSGATTGEDMVRELWETLQSNPDGLMPSRCVLTFGNGVTFEPTTYSSSALDGSRPGGSIEYRSAGKQTIYVLPSNLKDMAFEIVGPNRILLDGSCALVRVGAPAATTAANATTGPGNARTTAAGSSLPGEKAATTHAAKSASAACQVAGVQLGVDTVASVERDILQRGGSPASGGTGGGQSKFRLSAMSGDFRDVGTNVMAVSYDFDAAGTAGRLIAVMIANQANGGAEYEKLLAERKAAAASIAGPLQQKSATELVASAPGCQLRLLPNADSRFIHEVYQLPN